MKVLTGVVIALSIVWGLFQQVQIVEAKGQPARTLLSLSDLPPGFYEYQIMPSHVGTCKTYTRSFENIKRTRVLHSVTFCVDVDDSVKQMQMRRVTTGMNAPIYGSLQYVWM